MAKKHQLKLEPEKDFRVLGIVTTLKDFEIAFHLNKRLSFFFVKHKTDIILNRNLEKKKSLHTVFQYKQDSFVWNLIQNKSSLTTRRQEKTPTLQTDTIRGYLMEKYKQIDYLLQMPKTLTKQEEEKIIKNLKKMRNITSIFMLDINNNKDAEYLIFE